MFFGNTNFKLILAKGKKFTSTLLHHFNFYFLELLKYSQIKRFKTLKERFYYTSLFIGLYTLLSRQQKHMRGNDVVNQSSIKNSTKFLSCGTSSFLRNLYLLSSTPLTLIFNRDAISLLLMFIRR